MRLLERACNANGGDLTLTRDVIGDKIPPYAILSHTWWSDADEVTFQDLAGDGRAAQAKAGYEKLRFCAEQASRDGLRFCWVDTCCIDKSNKAELDEAINSMFKWYRDAARCYVYLSDVSGPGDLTASRWFKRGWTLQELLAPPSVEFFARGGTRLGDKRSLERQVLEITRIPVPALQGVPLSQFDIEERFAWAETRQTTREEDGAYCLLGIFGVFIPLIYGEGRESAARRLRKAIDEAQWLPAQTAPKSTGFTPTRKELDIVPVSRRFVGRQETIRRLHAVLDPASAEKRTRIAILYGLGGQGKTQVAAKYANDHRAEYQLILWVDGSSALTAERSFSRFANVLGCGNSMKPTAAVSAVLDVLAKVGQHTPWLLVLDNLDDPAPSYMKQVASWIPDAPLGHVILTTRIATWDLSSRVSGLVEIPALSVDDAVELLSRWSGSENRGYDKDEAIRIVERLGCMALLVNQAGAFISKALGGVMVEYLAYYNAACKELLSYGPQYAAEWDYQKHVEMKPSQPASAFATFQISFDHLLSKGQPIVTELLTLLAFLDRDNITIDLLCRGAVSKTRRDYEGIEEDTDPRSSGVTPWLVDLLSPAETRDDRVRMINLLMMSLEEHYFLQRSLALESDISHRKLRMHPVVHDWLRVRLIRDEQVKAAIGSILLIDHAIDDSLQFLTLDESNTALLPHIAFAVPILTGLLSDPGLQGKREHGLLLRAASRFGSLLRAHNQYEHAEPLLSLTWRQQTQGIDTRGLGLEFSDVDSIMSSKAARMTKNGGPARESPHAQSVYIHGLAPLIHSMAISRYHQGRNLDAFTLCSFLLARQNSEPAHWKCLCASETPRQLSMICQYRGERSASYQYARDAYFGFLLQLEPTHPRSRYAFLGYLSTCHGHEDPTAVFPFRPYMSAGGSKTMREKWVFVQADGVARDLEASIGPQATISRYARIIALILWPETFQAKTRELSKELDKSIAAGLYSLDEAVPVLDEPTLRLLVYFGDLLCYWYRYTRDAAAKGGEPPSRQWLVDARKYGARAWRGYHMVMPFIAESAGALLSHAYALDGRLGEARFWLQKTRDLIEANGGDLSQLQTLADLLLEPGSARVT